MKEDIKTGADIFELMRRFYEKLLADERIAYLFTDVAKINLETHLPHLTHFWEMVLFQKEGYTKNVMQIHKNLHDASPLNKEHFDIWLHYFKETVDELYAGENAERAKQRAVSIAVMMRIKVSEV